jgi:hypothetical protein
MKSILIGVDYREDADIGDSSTLDLYTPDHPGGGFGPTDQGAAVLDLEMPAAAAPFEATPEPELQPEPAMPFEAPLKDEVSTTLDDEPLVDFPVEMGQTDSSITPPTSEQPGVDHFEGIIDGGEFPSDELSGIAEPAAYDGQAPDTLMPLAERLEGTPPVMEREVPPEMEPAPQYNLDMTDSKAFEELLALKEDDDTGEFELGGDFADLLGGAEVTATAEPFAPAEEPDMMESRHRRDETHTYGPEEMARLAEMAEAATRRPPSDPGFQAPQPEVSVTPETPGNEKELAAEFGLLLDGVAEEAQPEVPVEAMPVDVIPEAPVEAIPELLVEAALEAGQAPAVEDQAGAGFADLLGGAAEETAPVTLESPPTEEAVLLDEQVSQDEMSQLLDGAFDEEAPVDLQPQSDVDVESPTQPILDVDILTAPPEPEIRAGIPAAPPAELPLAQAETQDAFPGVPVDVEFVGTPTEAPLEAPAEVLPEAPAEEIVDDSEDTGEEDLQSIEGVDSKELGGLMDVLGEDWGDDDDMEFEE